VEDGALCENSFLCFDGTCGNTCNDGTDCPEDGNTCAVYEYSVEDADYQYPLEVCVPTPGSNDACSSAGDCGDGETCLVQMVESETAFTYEFANKCVEANGDEGAFGAVCNDDSPCQSGFCIGDSEETNGTCSGPCTTASDCGSTTDEAGAILNGYCASFYWASAGTATDLDDLYNPLCVFDTGSASPCGEGFACSPGEACSPAAIGTLPSLPATVEWVCLALDAETAVGAMGDACESSSECASGLCVLPEVGNDPGYCSSFCSADAETTGCPAEGEWTCTDWTLIEREDAANNAVVQRCEM